MPGTPCSASVGTSGMVPERFSPVTATARSLPPRTCCDSTATEPTASSSWPPIASADIGPPCSARLFTLSGESLAK